MMFGLEPNGDDMIKALYETGMLEAQHGRTSADNSFEIPKLFRLGLVFEGKTIKVSVVNFETYEE